MLTKIELLNFKIWQKLTLQLAPLTILFGTNSAGKTSVLDALLMLKQTAASFDRRQHINFGGSERDFVDLGGFRDLVFKHDSEQRITIELEWNPNNPISFAPNKKIESEYYTYNALAYRVRWRRAVIERLRYEARLQDGSNAFFSPFSMEREVEAEDRYTIKTPPKTRATRGQPAKSPPPESCYGIPVEAARSYEEFDPLEFNRQFEALMARLIYIGPLRNYPKRTYLWTGTAPQEIGKSGENTIEALIASERRSPQKGKRKKSASLLGQVSHWLKELGLSDQLEMQAIDEDKRYYKTSVKIASEGLDSSLIDVGFGVSQVLPIVTLLFFAPEHSIVLIEQPEIHLHPSAQANLADLFLHVAHTRNLQLIVESHSEHIVRRLQRRIAEADDPHATLESIKMYFCEPGGAAGATVHKVEANLFGQIKNWPENFFGDITGDLEAMTAAAIRRKRSGR